VAGSSKAIVAINLADPTRVSSATTSATVLKMAPLDRMLAEAGPQVATARIAVVANVVAEEDAAAADAVVAAGAKVGIAKAPLRVVSPRRQVATVVGQRTHLRHRLHLCRRVTVATIITTRVVGMKAGLMTAGSARARSRRAKLVSPSRSFGLRHRHLTTGSLHPPTGNRPRLLNRRVQRSHRDRKSRERLQNT
jgi:hypothetical protein